ncbi:MAG: bifunctional hydroxymethylpyrimidine kinase/phosphomethylpyrimidine kinase [Deltaproteobacteria bacterium]|nr:MAG: bifunctional hydroxymethylpyrimidine kinase/phosphomethylpyrimidine kinase [Deltaproteobacteria bacterium]
MIKCVLVIAGSDSLGGAGIQADIRTIASLRAHAATIITSLTAQNSMGIRSIHHIPSSFIKDQFEAVMEDVMPDAAKIGMLGDLGAVQAVAECLARYHISPVVLDPVLRASRGRPLIESEALVFLRENLLPLTDVVTPNLYEAEVLSGIRLTSTQDMEEAALRIAQMGPNVVITGGHLKGECADLFYDSKEFHWFRSQKIDTPHTHGSGCVFSSALATGMAMGKNAVEATKMAHETTRCAIINSYVLGKGPGPVNPLGPVQACD